MSGHSPPLFVVTGAPRCGTHWFASVIQRAAAGSLVMLHEMAYAPYRPHGLAMQHLPWAEASWCAACFFKFHPEMAAETHVVHLQRDRDASIRSLILTRHAENCSTAYMQLLKKATFGRSHLGAENSPERAGRVYDLMNQMAAEFADEHVWVEKADVEWFNSFLDRVGVDGEATQEHLNDAFRDESVYPGGDAEPLEA